ncbi:MAG: Na+/H+ antiporter subunit E [Spirochaetia bacterium]
MKSLKGKLLLFVLLLLVWTALAYPLDQQELAVAAVVALIVLLLPLRSAAIFSEIRTSPKAIAYGIAYLFVFSAELLKANLDVAFRVLAPELPIRPGIVRVKTRLHTELGRTLLANSITLTPGTITVDTDGEYFYVHWINVASEDIEEATNRIVAKFERYLEVVCG